MLGAQSDFERGRKKGDCGRGCRSTGAKLDVVWQRGDGIMKWYKWLINLKLSLEGSRRKCPCKHKKIWNSEFTCSSGLSLSSSAPAASPLSKILRRPSRVAIVYFCCSTI